LGYSDLLTLNMVPNYPDTVPVFDFDSNSISISVSFSFWAA